MDLGNFCWEQRKEEQQLYSCEKIIPFFLPSMCICFLIHFRVLCFFPSPTVPSWLLGIKLSWFLSFTSCVISPAACMAFLFIIAFQQFVWDVSDLVGRLASVVEVLGYYFKMFVSVFSVETWGKKLLFFSSCPFWTGRMILPQ